MAEPDEMRDGQPAEARPAAGRSFEADRNVTHSGARGVIVAVVIAAIFVILVLAFSGRGGVPGVAGTPSQASGIVTAPESDSQAAPPQESGAASGQMPEEEQAGARQ